MNSNVRRLRRLPGNTRRLKVAWPAKCGADHDMQACQVLDISPHGACISGRINAASTGKVLLQCDDSAQIEATITWRRDDRTGLCFHQGQSWIQDKCSRRFDAASWI